MRKLQYLTLLICCAAMSSRAWSQEKSPSELAMEAASVANKFTFILFHRVNDATTQRLHRRLTDESAKRTDTEVLTIQLNDAAEGRLIQRFDATRMPMPAVVVVAPNDAVTGVFPQKLTPQEFHGAIVTPGYARCIKALQNGQLVLLCVQPETNGFVPRGVKRFQADPQYGSRTDVVNIVATDPAEARLLKELGIDSRIASPMVVFMAPPGAMLGRFDAQVTSATLASKLAAAGKCCDDPNCKHGRSAQNRSSQNR
jgi:hypothetical protein